MKYVSTGFFMLRNNTLPYMFDKYNLIDNRIFRESLLISSMSLFKSLDESYNKKLKDKQLKKLEFSIYEYKKRITNRPTPFGLFSSVSCGLIDKNNSFSFEYDDFSKKATVDFKWFMDVIEKLESKVALNNSKIKVQINNMLYNFENAYILDEKSNYGKTSLSTINRRFITKKSKLLKTTLELAKDPISIDILKEKLNDLFNYTDNQIENYLQKLINNELLITELRPSSFDNNLLDNLVQVIEKNKLDDKLLNKLLIVEEHIKKYQDDKIGYGIKDYLKLIDSMKSISSENAVLKVDLKSNFNKKPILSEEIANVVLEGAEKIISIAPQQKIGWIPEYLSRFIEKYGIDQVININKVLDETFGLGYPDIYSKNKETNIKPNSKVYDYLNKLGIESIIDGKESIILSNKDWKNMNELQDDKLATFNEDTYPNSGEIYFKLLKNKDNKYKIILSGAMGSLSVGNTFGRFWSILNTEEREQIINAQNKINSSEKELNIEISEIPSYGKNGNVMNNHSNLKRSLKLRNINNSVDSIDINDVYIGATLNGFYLYSKKENKMLNFSSNSMINYNYCSRLYRFLVEVSLSNVKSLFPVSTSLNSNFEPRIEWKNMVLKLCSWNISFEELIEDNRVNHEKLLNIMSTFNIPRYVLIEKGDNNLNIDLFNDKDIKILESNIKKYRKVKLTEDYLRNNPEFSPVLEINNEYFQSEFVMPFIRKESINSVKEKVDFSLINSKDYDSTSQFIRNDWVYFEIFIPNKLQNEVLVRYISGFIDYFKSINNNVLQWFFIRYKENDFDTLRLRIKTSEKLNSSIIIESFKYFFENIYKYGMAKDYLIRRYVPETYRYGGENNLILSENIFSMDSELVLKMLKMRLSFYDNLIISAVFSVLLFSSFGFSYEEISKHTNQFTNSKLKKEVHNLSRSSINYFKNDRKLLIDKYPDLFRQIQNINFIILKVKDNTKSLSDSRVIRLLDSYIHMHNNRLFGINQQIEGKVLTLTNIIAKGMCYFE